MEKVTGQTFISETDDAKVGFTALDEALSELAEAEVIGQRKNGRPLPAGSINRALRSFGDLVATNDAARSKEAKGFKRPSAG